MHKKPSIVVYYIITTLIICCYSCNRQEKNVTSGGKRDRYPADATRAEFKKIGNPSDSLTRLAEIDIFKGSEVPVGRIVGMAGLKEFLYFADSEQGLVHIIDRHSLDYKNSIGGEDPGRLNRIFGIYTDGTDIIVGNGSGPWLFKGYTAEGTFNYGIRNSGYLKGMISQDINSFFVADSVAIISKAIAFDNAKVARYHIYGDSATLIDGIIPVSDLHIEPDSNKATKSLTNMAVLQGNPTDSVFFVLPSNKYLVNAYTIQGKKLWSADLRSIPEVNNTYAIMSQLPFSSYFYSAASDESDNIYFHINDYEDINPNNSYEKIVKQTKEKDRGVNLIVVNIADKTYRVIKAEGRSVAPLDILDGKLWCFDYAKSQLILYQLPF